MTTTTTTTTTTCRISRPRLPRQPRPARLKSLTFTGCWTCRRRKVKCDERELNGCSVCEGAGLACAGYEVRLCWVQEGKQGATGRQTLSAQPTGGRRRGIKLHRHTSPVMTDDDIMRALTKLDSMLSPKDTETIGPFAIFQAEGFDTKDEETETETGQTAAHEPRDAPFDPVSPSPAIDIDTDPDTLRIDRFDDTFEELVDSMIVIDNALMPLSLPSSPPLSLSMPLFRDSQTAHLLYHFTNHVAELLQPVHHPGNPWRTTYFSFALEGCPELWLAQTTVSQSSHASLSLFHSLLSSAAFHLRNATDGAAAVDYHRLALQHRIKALQALNAATPQPTNQQLYLIHLTAMLSLVTVDTMAGEDSDFPVHLKACYQLKKPAVVEEQAEEGGGSQIYSICRFLTLLARTTSPVIVARPWREERDDTDADATHPTPSFNIPNFRDSERSVEYMYGITPALGNMLAKTCQMAEHLAYHREANDSVLLLSPSLQAACAALGDELAAWTVDDEPFGLIQADNEAGQHTMREIARCQARAFHGAVLLYYCRTLSTYGLQDRRVSPVAVDVHAQVQVIWAQLTTAEDLKETYYHNHVCSLKRSAPMSWPAFIAACEAAPHDRPLWVAWWERVNRGYRIGNFARQWQIIQDVWALQDRVEAQGHGSIGWREALARTGKLVLPI